MDRKRRRNRSEEGRPAAPAAPWRLAVFSCARRYEEGGNGLLKSGTDIRTMQDLVGQAEVSTRMIYLHLLKRPGAGARSPTSRDAGTPRNGRLEDTRSSLGI